MNIDNNIFFSTNEILLENDTLNNDDINNAFEEILKSTNIHSNESCTNIWNSDKLYYKEEFTVKELLKICKYYGIDKNIKGLKCKKEDIIDTIIFFENLPENFDIVFQRNKMWTYMNEIKMDSKMKQYIIWN